SMPRMEPVNRRILLMKKRWFSLFLMLVPGLFIFILSGCVKSSVHKSVELELAKTQGGLDQSKQEIRTLKGELAKKENAIEDLEKRISIYQANEELHTQDFERLAKKNVELSSELANLTRLNTALNETTLSQDDRLEAMRLKLLQEAEAKEAELDRLKTTYDQLVGELQQEIHEGEITITRVMDKLSVNLVEKILFDSGSAEIKTNGLEVLRRVGNILLDLTDKEIRVEGHTDNVPIGFRLREKFPTNWELSAARAINVVRYFSEQLGVKPRYLSAVGLADSHPVSENDSPEGRAQNRRIEIVLLPLDMTDVLQDLKPATEPATNPEPVTHAPKENTEKTETGKEKDHGP
ncbi:MAG TPA: OmpA family protein, partial [Nitrospiria bacterium]